MTRYIYDRKHDLIVTALVSTGKVQAGAILESDYMLEEIARWMFSLPADAAIRIDKE